MNFVKLFLAALAGFLLGAAIFHAPVVRAQGETQGHVYQVSGTPTTMGSLPVGRGTPISLSCVAGTGYNGVTCFVLTAQ